MELPFSYDVTSEETRFEFDPAIMGSPVESPASHDPMLPLDPMIPADHGSSIDSTYPMPSVDTMIPMAPIMGSMYDRNVLYQLAQQHLAQANFLSSLAIMTPQASVYPDPSQYDQRLMYPELSTNYPLYYPDGPWSFDFNTAPAAFPPQSQSNETNLETVSEALESKQLVEKSAKSRKEPLPPNEERRARLQRNHEEEALTAPLSELIKDAPSDIVEFDVGAFVNRSVAERRRQARKQGRVGRPMNVFMLYRKAFVDCTAWFKDNQSHDRLSRTVGVSWAMEPEDIKNRFREYARFEVENHRLAFPNYKFSPSARKTASRRSDAVNH